MNGSLGWHFYDRTPLSSDDPLPAACGFLPLKCIAISSLRAAACGLAMTNILPTRVKVGQASSAACFSA
jgi:hypothetical protein